MRPFAAVIEPFRVQYHVDFRSPGHPHSSAERPRITKGSRGVATAGETRAVSCRARDRLGEKAQPPPTARAEDHAEAPLNSQRQASESFLSSACSAASGLSG